jgi:hypothetical protein
MDDIKVSGGTVRYGTETLKCCDVDCYLASLALPRRLEFSIGEFRLYQTEQ